MDGTVHASSKSVEWSTPQALFDEINKNYDFTLDACATDDNAKCEKYFTLEHDGLEQQWSGTVWCNPPYGRDIIKWVQKAHDSAKDGTIVVCLLPARTDTRWFHDYCINGQITFIRGRIKFGGAKHNAPFPSMLVVFGDDSRRVKKYLNRD